MALSLTNHLIPTKFVDRFELNSSEDFDILCHYVTIHLYDNTTNEVTKEMDWNCDCHTHHEHKHESVDFVTQNCDESAEYCFDLYKGSSFDMDVIYKDECKHPVNLTGYTANCACQYKDKTFTINCEICDAMEGKIRMFLSSYETSRIFTLDYKYTKHTDYTYQLNLVSPSNYVYRIMEGTVSVIPSAGGAC